MTSSDTEQDGGYFEGGLQQLGHALAKAHPLVDERDPDTETEDDRNV